MFSRPDFSPSYRSTCTADAEPGVQPGGGAAAEPPAPAPAAAEAPPPPEPPPVDPVAICDGLIASATALQRMGASLAQTASGEGAQALAETQVAQQHLAAAQQEADHAAALTARAAADGATASSQQADGADAGASATQARALYGAAAILLGLSEPALAEQVLGHADALRAHAAELLARHA